jgi:uncharacterized membrane protein YfcA
MNVGRWLTVGKTMDSATQHVLLVVFLATMIRSTFGFGEALVAVPLLSLLFLSKLPLLSPFFSRSR